MTGIGRAHGMCLIGLDGRVITVEAHVANGLPAFTIVGLADTTVHESRQRIRAAFASSNMPWPRGRITINLSPAWLPKNGSGLDLALAAAILNTQGVDIADGIYMGELGLDGRVAPVRGILPSMLAASRLGSERVTVPEGNFDEATIVPDIAVEPIHHLTDLLGIRLPMAVGSSVRDSPPRSYLAPAVCPEAPSAAPPDFADVRGQEQAVMACEVAAVGGHHMMMVGPPGVGKSMIAARLPGILPPLQNAEALELSSITSLVRPLDGLTAQRPFIAPHHTSTTVALLGGGSGIPSPGAISLAHTGVLFLDETPEFRAQVLQALRQPLETGFVDLHRSNYHVRYPARTQVVMAANPCPCGKGSERGSSCTCTPHMKMRYQSRLGGPMTDRIDIRLFLHRVDRSTLRPRAKSELSAAIRERVIAARERSRKRLDEAGVLSNALLPGPWLRSSTKVPPETERRLENSLAAGTLSMRGVDRIFRMAWSAADLAGNEQPTNGDFTLAYILRGGDWTDR